MTAEYWEPWKPEVGQRVRVRLSGECNFKGEPASACEEFGGHWAETNGHVGKVVEIDGSDILSEQGHRYLVHFPRLFRLPSGEHFNCSDFAAIELEPVE